MSAAKSPMYRREYFCRQRRKSFDAAARVGCLEGVTRGILMEIAPEAGISVIDKR